MLWKRERGSRRKKEEGGGEDGVGKRVQGYTNCGMVVKETKCTKEGDVCCSRTEKHNMSLSLALSIPDSGPEVNCCIDAAWLGKVRGREGWAVRVQPAETTNHSLLPKVHCCCEGVYSTQYAYIRRGLWMNSTKSMYS